MKKLLLATILFVASTLSLSAQYAIENLSMSYGDEIKDNENKIVKIIGEANGKIYALALKKKDFSLKIGYTNLTSRKKQDKLGRMSLNL